MSYHGTTLIGQWTEFVAEVVRQLPRADDPRLPVIVDKYSNGSGGFQGALLKKDLEEALLSSNKEPKLLRRVGVAAVYGTEKFVARDHLKDANVGWMGDNFKKLFLSNVEEAVADIAVAIYRLEQSSLDAPIMAELGERTVIKLAHFFELLKKQSCGESGVLLTNGYVNVAYIKGGDGNVWAVRAAWASGGRCWHVEASSVESSRRWLGGRQILSRDSIS